jgi:hypothetical protein
MAAARLYFHLLGLFRLLQSDHPIAGFDQVRLQHLPARLVLQCASPISWQQFAFQTIQRRADWRDTPTSCKL